MFPARSFPELLIFNTKARRNSFDGKSYLCPLGDTVPRLFFSFFLGLLTSMNVKLTI